MVRYVYLFTWFTHCFRWFNSSTYKCILHSIFVLNVILGTGYFAEGVLFGSAGLIIIIEYYRSEAKSLRSKLRQEEREEKERKDLEDRFQMIEMKIDALMKQNEERLRILKKKTDEQQQGWWGWFNWPTDRCRNWGMRYFQLQTDLSSSPVNSTECVDFIYIVFTSQ